MTRHPILARSETLGQILEGIIELQGGFFDPEQDLAAIYTIKNDVIRMQAGYGHDKSTFELSYQGNGLVNDVFQTKTPLIDNNVRQNPRARNLDVGSYAKRNIKSALLAPILFHRERQPELQGVLELTSAQQKFSEEDVTRISTLLKIAGAALADKHERDAAYEFPRYLQHEFRTPLTVALGFSELSERVLNQEFTSNSTQTLRRYLSTINHSMHQLKQFTQDVDMIDRLSRNSLIPDTKYFDLLGLVHAHIEGAKIHDKKIYFTPPISSSMIRADPMQVGQALNKLIENAIQHAKNEVHVQMMSSQQRQESLIDISNDGPSIPVTDIRKIFSKNFTTSDRGSGLGLYIAKKLIETNKGHLDYIPVVGGAKFRITLGAK